MLSVVEVGFAPWDACWMIPTLVFDDEVRSPKPRLVLSQSVALLVPSANGFTFSDVDKIQRCRRFMSCRFRCNKAIRDEKGVYWVITAGDDTLQALVGGIDAGRTSG